MNQNYKERYNLQPDENINYVGEIHPINIINDYSLWLGIMSIIISMYLKVQGVASLELLLYVSVFLIVLGLVKGVIYFKTTDYLITNKRLLAKVGFIKRDIIEMEFNKMESIILKQSILGRILNYGTIYCSGVGANGIRVESISKPLFFRSILNKLKSASV